MKKLALALAILLIAAFYVTPVMASDFSAGGNYRLEAVSNDPGADEKSEYFDQRFRVAFSWKVNDNVSAQLRGDFAETRWGLNQANEAYRPLAGNDTIMIDRAWVKINQGPMTLTVGQQGGDWGLATLWSDQFQGIQADFDFSPVTLKLLYVKESEGGAAGTTLTDDSANDDTDTYGASLLYGTDAFSGGLSFATKRDEATDGAKNGYSLHFIVPIANLTLSGAGEIFTGDDGAGTDYAGTQFHAALDMAFSKAFKGGITVLWADSVAADETQLTAISDDFGFKPLDYDGALAYNNGYFGGATGIFDMAGAAGSGVLGIVGDVQFAVSEAVTIYGKLGWAEPNEKTGALDSKMYAIANIDYAWMPAVTLSGGVGYVKPDYTDNTVDDAVVSLTMQLGVSF